MAANFNWMDYTEFVNHLKTQGISFTEEVEVDLEHHMTEYTEVTPERKYKPRAFSTDGGWQLLN